MCAKKVAVINALDRVLDGLGEELIEASDEEIMAAARELGMDPTMRGSAAFLGLKYPLLRHPSDFFEGFDLQGLLPAPAPRLDGPATEPPLEGSRRRKKN